MKVDAKLCTGDLRFALTIAACALMLCLNLADGFAGEARHVLALVALAPVALVLCALIRAKRRQV